MKTTLKYEEVISCFIIMLRYILDMDKIYHHILFRDFEEKTDNEKIEFLNQLIDCEISKADSEIDYDLVQECSDFIKELMPDSEKSKEAELIAIRDSIKRGHAHKGMILTKKLRFSTPQKRWLKISAIVAASIVLVLGSLSVAAISNGYSNAFEYVSDTVNDLIHWISGKSAEVSNITVIKNGETAKYATLDDFLHEEDITFLYPAQLPEGEKISSIVITSDFEKGDYLIIITFLNSRTSITIRDHFLYDLTKISGQDSITTSYGSFVVIEKDDGTMQAICQYNSYEYSIASNSYDNIKIIVKNMREVQK